MKKEPIRVAQVVGKMVGGGVEAVVMNYYRNIDKTKVQFDFIIDSDSTLVPREEIESMGGRIIEIPPYQKLPSYIRKLKKVFKENNYKIVHSHINTLSVFPLFAAYLAGVPVRIAHSHSTAGKGETKRNIMKYCLRPFSKVFATNYFACTKYAGEWLFGKKANVYVMNNGIDLDKFKFDKKIREDLRKKLKIEKDTVVIGHVGRFMKQKNHEFIIDIFNEYQKENKNSILLLVGDGNLQNETKEKVKNLKLTRKVKFLGNRNDVNDLYQAMDCFLFPSLYEGLGIVLVEAQVSGLPCICSDIVPEDARICENIEFINLNENLSKWVSNIGVIGKRKSHKKEASEKYDIKNESKKLLNVYLNY